MLSLAMRPALELLWLDPKSCPRLRRKPAWQRILDEARAVTGPAVVPELPNQAASPEDRADVFEVLTRAEESDGAAVRTAVAAGIRADGKFAPPLLVVEGELVFAFDELEVLKGLIANAIPFAADDKDLQATVSAAKEYASLPGLLPTPAAVEALARRIREAFARVPRGVPADFLDAQTERALLEHRKYQTRAFHGAPHLRISLRQRGDETPLLAFAPTDVATKLPLERQLTARLVVEAHVFSDQYDPHPIALEILAVARRVPRPDQGLSASSVR
jgi:hypothetical protein